MSTVAGFLRRAQRWQYYYPVERLHFVVGMDGKSPLGELGLDLTEEFACFPVVLFDEVAVIWASKGGHDVLAYYRVGVRHGLVTRNQARGQPRVKLY